MWVLLYHSDRNFKISDVSCISEQPDDTDITITVILSQELNAKALVISEYWHFLEELKEMKLKISMYFFYVNSSPLRLTDSWILFIIS